MNLIEQLKQLLDDEDRLWTCEDIGNYLKLSKSSVQSRIVCRPEFPTAIQLANVGTRRWVPAEVKEWALTLR